MICPGNYRSVSFPSRAPSRYPESMYWTAPTLHLIADCKKMTSLAVFSTYSALTSLIDFRCFATMDSLHAHSILSTICSSCIYSAHQIFIGKFRAYVPVRFHFHGDEFRFPSYIGILNGPQIFNWTLNFSERLMTLLVKGFWSLRRLEKIRRPCSNLGPFLTTHLTFVKA